MTDQQSAASRPGPWLEGRQGAVSLTFDDGLSSQWAVALPLLEEFDLRGTFYVTPPRDDDEAARQIELTPWRAAASRGHEVGNHSLTHPCPRNFPWMAGRLSLEEMTLEDLESDVLEAERRLRAAIPEQTARTFAYPCAQSHVGVDATRQSYVPVIARHFVAARGIGETANDPARCELQYLWSWSVERRSGAELIGLAERAAVDGRWSVLTFHGIDEGHLPVAEVDLRELCGFLARHRDRLWTAPVVTVAQRIRDWRQAEG